MKITTFLILAACLQVSAKGISQTVTFSGKDVPLETVFSAVKQQTGYLVFYDYAVLDGSKPVSVSAKDEPLREFLARILKGQLLDFSITKKTIFIKKTAVVSPSIQNTSSVIDAPPPFPVSGRITDAEGNPLTGASIKIKGSKVGTSTDADGRFSINANEGDVLVVSFVGYMGMSVKITQANNGPTAVVVAIDKQSGMGQENSEATSALVVSSDRQGNTNPAGSGISLLFKLFPSVSSLNEVIVNKGYYTEKQKLSVSNVGRVTEKDIEKQPVSNPLLALQGRVPGLFITQTSGVSGSSVKVRIQGQNSILNGNNPLYVIDGVPLVTELPRTGNDWTLAPTGANFSGFGNPLSYINTSDIESIEILKDADATAIYGSRGANGVILITTKKGKAGPMRLDLDLQTGFGDVANKLEMMNTRQYLDMRYEAFHNDGIDWRNSSVSANDLKVWDTTRYTDWQKQLIGGTANFTKVNASVSGGTNLIRYLIGGTYQKETTVFPFPDEFADTKGSVHFNLNANSTNQKLKLQFSGNYLYDRNQLPRTDLTQAALLTEPNAPGVYNTDGSINWAPDASGTSTSPYNPMVGIYTKYRNNTSNLIGNFTFNYTILPGFSVGSSIGYTDMQTDDFSPSPLISVRPENRSTNLRSASYGERKINSWILEPQATYSKKAGDHTIELLAGSTILSNRTDAGYLFGQGYISDEVLENINAATSVVSVKLEASKAQYKYNAIFGRVNYTWKDKYILNATGRRDGSSRFGGDNRFHNFGSVGGAWIFSNEDFIKSKFDFLSFGKLRGSYGIAGNDQIGDYQFLSLYNFSTPYQGTNSLLPAGLPNPHLQWEETKKLQLGLDIAFWEDRLQANITYVRNRSSNQLLRYELPTVAGFPSILSNFPATVVNRNLEIFVSSANIKSKNLSWITKFNITIPHNELVVFPNLSTSTYNNTLIVGESINTRRLLRFISVDPATGNYFYASKTDPFNPKFPDDYTSRVNMDPKFYGGLQNNISYKGFEFDFLFQFVKKLGFNDIFWNGNRYPGEFVSGFSNQPVTVLDRWQKQGDNAAIKKFTTSGDPYITSTDLRFSADASYIRLKNASISWELPAEWINKVHFKKCKVYLHGQNLLTITRYPLDPENQNLFSIALPPLRVWTMGVQIGL